MELTKILDHSAKVQRIVHMIETLKRGRSVYLTQKKSVTELVADLRREAQALAAACEAET